MPKIIVYLKEADARELEQAGFDPATWVRDMVRALLEKRKESHDGA